MDRVIHLWLEGGIARAHACHLRGAGGGEGAGADEVLVCHQGRLIDASGAIPGLRVGEKCSRLAQLRPGAAVVSYDPGKCQASARRFWDMGTGVSPVVDPEAENRIFLGWNTAWPERLERTVAGLAREAVPALGYRLLGAVASSKVVARGAAEWMYHILGQEQRPPLPGAARGNRLVPLAGGWWLELTPQGEGEFWASLPVRYLWPLPEEVVERFCRLGLYRIGDVAALGAETLSLKFGELGETISRLARGEGPDVVRPRHPPARIERQLSFADPVYDYGAVARGLKWLAREAAAALRQKGYGTRELTLEVEWEGGARARAERQLPRVEGDPARLALLAGLLWERLLLDRGRGAADRRVIPRSAGGQVPADRAGLPPGAGGRVGRTDERARTGGVQAVRVVASGLEEAWFGQLQLFPGEEPAPSEPAADRLQAVLEALRERYAREVVRVGMVPARRQLMLSFYS